MGGMSCNAWPYKAHSLSITGLPMLSGGGVVAVVIQEPRGPGSTLQFLTQMTGSVIFEF